MKYFSKKIVSTKIISIILILIFFGVAGLSWFFISSNKQIKVSEEIEKATNTVAMITNPTPTIPPIPSQKILPTDYHIFQTFNNCGPAALSMALRFYGVNVSQEELGNALRPYQVPGGDNDDKSVTLEELAEKSKEYGFIPYHRPMGNPE